MSPPSTCYTASQYFRCYLTVLDRFRVFHNYGKKVELKQTFFFAFLVIFLTSARVLYLFSCYLFKSGMSVYFCFYISIGQIYMLSDQTFLCLRTRSKCVFYIFQDYEPLLSFTSSHRDLIWSQYFQISNPFVPLVPLTPPGIYPNIIIPGGLSPDFSFDILI